MQKRFAVRADRIARRRLMPFRISQASNLAEKKINDFHFLPTGNAETAEL
jgi:hypothetical protein